MDFNKIVSELGRSGVLGGFAGGAVGGALMSNKKVRKHSGTLLKAGGIAALGTLAWKAYRGYSESQGQPGQSQGGRPPEDVAWQSLQQEGFKLEDQAESVESRSMTIIQAMIAAASSDGLLDNEERSRIMDTVATMTLDAQEKAALFDALAQPLSLSEVCERVSCPELAAEVYLSSAMVLDAQDTASRFYLEGLAQRLSIPPQLVAELDSTVHQELGAAA